MNTALDLFVTQGFQQTSMSQISKVSKVAVGTIYHYFESKIELIEQLYIEVKARVKEEIHLTEAELNLDLKSKLKLVWLKVFFYFKNNRTAFFFVHTNTYANFISKDIRDKTLMTYHQAVDMVAEGINTGIIEQNDCLFVMRWIYNNIATVIELEFDDETEVSKMQLDKYYEMTWKSLT